VKLDDYKLVFAASGLIGVLLLASPLIGMVLSLPGGEHFSELYLLGPGHTAEDYPFNIAAGQNYSVYVGVVNHMAASAYYVPYVKLRNQTEVLPNAIVGAPSSLPPVCKYRFFVAYGGIWESLLTFSISEASFSANQSFIKRIIVNNVRFDADKPAEWNINTIGFYYELFMELWTFNPQSSSVQFNNRFVGLYMNLTTTTV
jgi:hypothetical protein